GSMKRILVANRGEIAIRVLRAAAELGLRTVALYTYEDRYSLHRYKADEAYLIGDQDEPLAPYLNIEEIIKLSLRRNIDAIHPGYGFLSENVDFVRRCEEVGITFIGPTSKVMHELGDKVRGKALAREVGVPVIEDSQVDLNNIEAAQKEAKRIGFPVIIKAAAGGGGRGMRVVRSEKELENAFLEAKGEAKRSFGNDTLFFEKYIENPKHIEVQLLGDNYGNLVHLFERDCSVQRRFQKVVEVAPSPSLAQETKEKLFEYALQIGNRVHYNNAGTVEFLVDASSNPYFIEVNPRIQVEHTVTEEVTGVDLVRSQILIAQGHALDHSSINIPNQEALTCSGFAIQCRITTEDPQKDFRPTFGKLIAYRSPGGFGIRLDAGSAYAGAVISPFFDSLLVKVTASGRTLDGASERLIRALEEFRIRGVMTNVSFLENVLYHEVFRKGEATVGFIEKHPELLEAKRRRNRATKVLTYLAEVAVNGNPDVKSIDRSRTFRTPHIPSFDAYGEHPAGTKQKLSELGPEKFSSWLRESKSIQYTDTTFRDAHQSLLATRFRTVDMIRIAESYAKNHPEVFSLEVWGGATFDVALRFLHECPWERLKLLREAIPNILLQMLLRGSNAVGYTAYPDNLIVSFVEKAWETGIDIFRIFDSLNWLPAMETSIKTVRERTGAIAEVCICYTGDICDKSRTKFTLEYYLDLAKRIEDAGAHILCIKDMAGLLKPNGSTILITELRKALSIPVHLHTHDTSSIQAATYLNAIEAGVDVIDVALASMSGLTSQPNFNSLVAMLKGHERELPLDLHSLNEFSNYFEIIREYYYPFESGLKAGTAQVYEHEIPGGQYSNLGPQARGLGLEDRFEDIKKNYRDVNDLLGDVIKVTPSSKVVGDLAMYLTSNNLTVQDIKDRPDELSFPESLKGLMRGDLGQAYGGFPDWLQKAVLKGEQPYTNRPNENMTPIDLDGEFASFIDTFGKECSYLDFLSYKLYSKVFEEFYAHVATYGQVQHIPTLPFFFGLALGEEIFVEIDQGKTLIVRLVYVSDPNEEGMRTVSFKLNGQTRNVEVLDRSAITTKVTHAKANIEGDVGAPLQGKLSRILVSNGDKVAQGDPLFMIEAMKMETTVTAPSDGTVEKVALSEGTLVEQEDLVVHIGANP
ncbi:MAG: pyruvate carboxylase, partial [Bdellovibrionales bacterium]|nr:pyruvate carboxylase [Bdellovibrionales bacterium]